uniref:Uncharacterized protein n=1 Tax=Rhizobium rhizogenes TaxID=359 RepID=A0A7S4ZT62_RHIRH|nr:hypothetical protein pC5.7d_688 [Rhizobium rhizogenes]
MKSAAIVLLLMSAERHRLLARVLKQQKTSLRPDRAMKPCPVTP